MNLHEYQAKQLLARHGVAVPAGEVVFSPAEARAAAEKLLAAGADAVVVKAQIHAGGRGKGVFQHGRHGGVKRCVSAEEVFQTAGAMLGQVLVTQQTGPQGRRVGKLLVERALAIRRELYVGVLLDRSRARPVVMASAAGGMDIEEVAARQPNQILREWIDPALGMMPFQARKLAVGLGLRGRALADAARLLPALYQTWWACDASMVEINPLAVVAGPDGHETVCAADAKMALDDNGLARHPDLQALRDLSEEAPLEIEAGRHALNYIQLDGIIACLVNGAGLAMATMDIIQHYGGEPANFLDVGGGANVDQVTAAFRIILQDPRVRAILVNIFGGIMDCNVIATGIVRAVTEARLTLPLVVRLEGNNVQAGRQTLAASGLAIRTADTMADAAQQVVEAARG